MAVHHKIRKKLPRSTFLLRVPQLWYRILLVATASGAVLLLGSWKPDAFYVTVDVDVDDTPQQSYYDSCLKRIGKNGVALRGTACNKRFHNRTTGPAVLLPGTFLSGRLYLMGAQLTTSYDQDEDSSVIITLFGIPGQAEIKWFKEEVCKSNFSRSAWSLARTKEEIVMHVQLDCLAENKSHYQPCGASPIEMTLMETISVDWNVDYLSLIWQANVTEWVDRDALRGARSEDGLSSIRVHFSLVAQGPAAEELLLLLLPTTTTPTTTNNTTFFHPVLSVDIPLATGSVGNVGPARKGSASTVDVGGSTFRQTEQDSTARTGASLCVATFGDSIRQYIPEFIRHHKKLGFAPIVLGVLDDDEFDYAGGGGRNRMEELQILLDIYIQDGTLVLFPASAPGMNCHTELLKIMFYNSCLYYSKGIAEYVAVFDLDEYWMPPSPTTFIQTLYAGTAANNSNSSSSTNNETAVETIQEAMEMVRRYHQIHGCHDETWCFHAFPSYTVHRRQTLDGNEVPDMSNTSSTTSLVDLFQFRDKEANTVWLKSVAKTKLTFSAGYHEFGSCRNPSGVGPWDVINPGERQPLREKVYVDNDSGEKSLCRNLRLLGFGSMHHFKNLVSIRGNIPNFQKDNESYRMDEYIQLFVPRD